MTFKNLIWHFHSLLLQPHCSSHIHTAPFSQSSDRWHVPFHKPPSNRSSRPHQEYVRYFWRAHYVHLKIETPISQLTLNLHPRTPQKRIFQLSCQEAGRKMQKQVQHAVPPPLKRRSIQKEPLSIKLQPGSNCPIALCEITKEPDRCAQNYSLLSV